MKTRFYHLLLSSFVSLFIFSANYTFSQEEKPVLKFSKHTDAILTIAWSPDAKIVATGSEDKTVLLWNADNGEVKATLQGNIRGVSGLCWTPDGNYLLTAGDKVIQVWDKDGKKLRNITGTNTDVRSISFSNDGKILAAGSYDNRIHVWDFTSGKILRVLEGHEKSVLAVCVSPDGKLLASGSLDETVRLWDLSTGKCLKIWKGHGANIFSVNFSPDGKYVLSAAKDNSLRLWDITKDQSIQSYIGHSLAVTCARFSPNGLWIVSGSVDKSVILWETFTGKKIYQFIGFDGAVNSISMEPKGDNFATASTDKKAMIWKMNKDLFTDFYFEKEIKQQMDSSYLFKPRGKSEARDAYENRQKHAAKKKAEIYSKYFDEYMKKAEAVANSK
jgi:WD40 repeat protein